MLNKTLSITKILYLGYSFCLFDNVSNHFIYAYNILHNTQINKRVKR